MGLATNVVVMQVFGSQHRRGETQGIAMRQRKRKLGWLTGRQALDPSSDERFAFGVGRERRQRWHRGRVAATAETLEKHRLVWAARRDDRSVHEPEVTTLRRNAANTHHV